MSDDRQPHPSTANRYPPSRPPPTAMNTKIALITGSTSGIGRGIAELFASLGARVVVHGLDEAEAVAVATRLSEHGWSAAAVAGDLADVEACRRIVRFTIEHYGGIDILVNNAATTAARLPRRRPGRVVGQDHAHQPACAVPLPAGGGEIDEDAGRRLHPEHRLGQCLCRRAEARALLGFEGRPHDADAQRRRDTEPPPASASTRSTSAGR